MVDIRFHRIPRIALIMLCIPTLQFMFIYHVIAPSLIAASEAWIIYYAGFYWGKLGGGDLKFAPLIAVLIPFNTRQILHMISLFRGEWMISYTTAVSVSAYHVPLISTIVLIVVWIVLAQIMTIFAVILRRILLKIGYGERIAHAPAMIIAAGLICVAETIMYS